MNYRLTDLIDVEKTQRLLQDFMDAHGIPSAILDLEGVVLVTSRWRRVCTAFHRVHEVTCRRCVESDTKLANELLEGKPFSLYRCGNGLTDAASPIIIEGKHVANAFIGQFFTQAPDLDFFHRQAGELGFDESAYMEALSEIPIVHESILPSVLSFLTSFAEMIASLGLKQLEQLQTEKELRKAQQILEVKNQKLKESEEDLNRAQAVARTGSWRLDVLRNVLHWSDETYRIFCIPRGVPMTYEAFLAAIHPKDRDFVNQSWKAALGGIPYDIEHRIIAGDSVKWVRERAEQELDGEGKLIGGFGSVQDITELKQMEEELRKSHDELELRVQERTAELTEAMARLELMNQELREFTKVASHDLQEPLRKIQAFGDRLRSRCAHKLDEAERDYLTRMEGAANRAQRLILDLLEFSRVTTGPEALKTVDLNDTAAEVAQVFQYPFRLDGPVVELSNLPTIEADPVQMKQLFRDLIGNALKFKKEGERPRVRVYARVQGNSTCLCFEDNGIGFDEKYLDRIFAPFQRLHGHGAYEGTGIGLAICRKIVERHGWTITARSTPGAGSTFVVTIPANASEKI